MKLIHCADLHLDSKLQTSLDSLEAKKRRAEILNNFSRLVSFAEDRGVAAILISGDLFDVRTVSATARNQVLGEIRNHPTISFYYLRGNHDANDCLTQNGEMPPENLFTFRDSWQSYTLADTNIIVTGAELEGDRGGQLEASLILKPEDFNIVMLHGMVSDYGAKKGERISLNALRNKHIDYLALGHIHQYQEGVLPPRGIWAYPGCLEGRGMDEAGEHGFVLLDIQPETHAFTREFIPFAYRRVIEVPVDITGCLQTIEIQSRIAKACEDSGATNLDYVRILLTGQVDAEAEKNQEQLEKAFAPRYYVVRVEDNTRFRVDYTAYEKDASLKGEFIRLVRSRQDLSQEEKAEIIRAGILSLRKEEF